jgi:flagellar basal-body rod modification protein FlgD
MAQTQASKKDENVGEKLNQVAGRVNDSRFVDAKKHNKLDKDGFLKLLSYQLQNQDPMKPMDQKQFAADIAQFSQVEQLANMNKQLGTMGDNMPAETKFHGASFLGKEVLTQGTTVKYDGQGTASLPFKLPEEAKELRIRVFDSSNQLVAQIEKQGMSSGSHMLTWDGVMNDGTRAVPDEYRFEVDAWNEKFEKFKGKTQATGLVTGVSFQGGETLLSLDNGQNVFLRDVINFKLPKDNNSSTQENNAMGQEKPQLNKKAHSAYNQIQHNSNQ